MGAWEPWLLSPKQPRSMLNSYTSLRPFLQSAELVDELLDLFAVAVSCECLMRGVRCRVRTFEWDWEGEDERDYLINSTIFGGIRGWERISN